MAPGNPLLGRRRSLQPTGMGPSRSERPLPAFRRRKEIFMLRVPSKTTWRLFLMEEFGRPPCPLGFGVFEVDLRAGELRKKGLKINCRNYLFRSWSYCWSGQARCYTRESFFRSSCEGVPSLPATLQLFWSAKVYLSIGSEEMGRSASGFGVHLGTQ